MKALYRYIIRSFIGPLGLTLVIALFILLMQFLWKYIDDLVGKGLSFYVITKFMLWVSLTLIPLALPMAILLASIMTFGNLAENYELVALKSSGLSLPKIMAPLVVVVFLISIGAFLFSNYALPVVNLKMDSLLWDIQNAKPGLNIQQDIFYNGINGYSIRIGKKDPDQETVHNIMMYDHTANQGNVKLEMAKSGKMKMSTDQRYLVFTMNDGNEYEEMMDNNRQQPTHPQMVNHFEKQTIYFDLSGFKFSRTKEELFKSNYQMMDMRQLSASTDSLSHQLNKNKKVFGKQLDVNFLSTANYPRRAFALQKTNTSASQNKMIVLDAALNSIRNTREFVKNSSMQFDEMNENILSRELVWYRNFTFPFSCLLLFFIGAPLGAIIRKGGLGLPVVVAALFFVLYYILSIMGIKFAKEEVMSVFTGSWMSAAILAPVGAFFTYKASVDSSIFDRDAYTRFFNRIITAISITFARS